MDELRRGEPYAVEFVPTDRMLLPPDREGMRRKASPCVECELRLRGGSRCRKLCSVDRWRNNRERSRAPSGASWHRPSGIAKGRSEVKSC